MPLPSCCPMRLVQPVSLTPIHELRFPSIVSQDASVAEDACRNTAVPLPPSQPAVTFPRALDSYVQGAAEAKSPSSTWLVVSARREMSVAFATRLGPMLPRARNFAGVSQDTFAGTHGKVAFAPSRSTPFKVRPVAVPIVHETVRDALLFSLTIGASPRTGAARHPSSALATRNARTPSAPIRSEERRVGKEGRSRGGPGRE